MKATTDTGTVELGTTEAGVTIGIVDFSRRTTDDFGVTTVTRRGFARRMAARIVLPFDEVDAVQRQLAALRATKARWTADERFAWLDFEGFYRDFEIDLALPPYSHCTLTVEGLVETETVEDDGGDPAPDGESSSLLLLHPVAIGDGELTDSSVPETDWPQWSAEATYDLGDRVIKTATHRIYESATDGNTGHDPEAATGEWIDVGPTNRWAMFDQALGTASTATGSIAVVIDPGAVGAVALLDVTGSTVRVQTTGYDKTKAAGPGAVTFLDLPGAGDPITVTVLGAGEVAVGTLLAGALLPLGSTEANPTAAITDYSRKEADDFGEIEVVERAWAKRMTARARIRTEAIDQVANRIAAVRATPALWIGKDGLDSLTIYGFFKDFSIETSEPLSTLNLQVEGLAKAAPIPPRTIEWVNVEDSDPSHPKPEDGATKGAPEGTPVGDRNAEDVIDAIDSHTNELQVLYDDMAAAEAALAAAQADLAAAQAELDQAEADILAAQGDIANLFTASAETDSAVSAARAQAQAGLDQIAAALVQAQTDLAAQRAIMRDAGISVDPATGQVRLHAFDRSEERLNAVDIRLDAVDAEILLKASTTYVDQKITEAVLDPSQLAELDELYTRMATAELELDGLDAEVQLRATLIEVSAIEGRVTTAESDISALEGQIATKVDTTTFDALETRVDSAESTLSAIDGASITEAVRTARVLSSSADEQDAAGLSALLTGDAAKRDQVAAVAEARRELTAKIVDDVSAEASARQALAVRVGAAEASIVSESLARVAQDSVLAGQITVVSADLDDVSATVTTQGTAIASLESSYASLSSTVSTQGSTIASQGTAITNLQGNYASLSSTVTALGSDIDSVEASVTQNATAISNLEGDFASLSSTVSTLNSMVSTQGSAISTLQSSTASLQSTVSAQGVTVSEHSAAIAGVEGDVTAMAGRWSAAINVNGRVVGLVKLDGTGQTSTLDVEADAFRIMKSGGGERFEFSDGNGRVYDSSGTLRVRWGVWS